MPNSLLGICFWAGVPEGAVERGEWGLMVRSLSGDCRTEEGLEEAIGGEFGRLPTDEPVLSHVRKQRIRKRKRRSLQTLQNSLRIPAPKNNRPSAPPEQDQEFPPTTPSHVQRDHQARQRGQIFWMVADLPNRSQSNNSIWSLKILCHTTSQDREDWITSRITPFNTRDMHRGRSRMSGFLSRANLCS